ncbi:MAG: hypothetical protein WD114_04480 [Phycisphaerales bacterium]
MHRTKTIVLLLIAAMLPAWAPTGDKPDPDAPGFVHETTDAYTARTIHGFTVRISPAALDHPDTTEPALERLEEQLADVLKRAPSHTDRALRGIVFWIEHNNPGFPCACYHPGAGWLAENGYNTDKEKGIEITNPAHFVEWTATDQPMMVLHELAHAYHDTVLGFDHPLVKECYRRARESGDYESVEHISGEPRRHYAMNNEREYFAELTESYFGTNDFAPFNREELAEFDPDGYAMIETLWLRPPHDGEEE